VLVITARVFMPSVELSEGLDGPQSVPDGIAVWKRKSGLRKTEQ